MGDQGQIIETFTILAPRYEEVVDSELNRFWGWSYAGFIRKLFEMTLVSNQDRILDVATGTGVIPHYLRKENLTSRRIHALDITLTMLKRAKQRFYASDQSDIDLVCASGMQMPYAKETFSLVICGLATHHMQVTELLQEMRRILLEGGRISIADVGGSQLWRQPIIKWLLRIAAYLYFLFKEGSARGWAEAMAVANIHSMEEWHDLLSASGFTEIKIIKLKSKYTWIPEPLMINAVKAQGGGS
jgi:ubiquinone/menaquinone biosynthesis C-methylase UbiE